MRNQRTYCPRSFSFPGRPCWYLWLHPADLFSAWPRHSYLNCRILAYSLDSLVDRVYDCLAVIYLNER